MFDRVLVFLRPKVLLLPAFIAGLAMSAFIGQANAGYAVDGSYIYSTTAGKAPLVFNDNFQSVKRKKRSYRKARTARKYNKSKSRYNRKKAARVARRAKRRTLRSRKRIRNRRVRTLRRSASRVSNSRKRNRRIRKRRVLRRRISSNRRYRGGSRNLRAILRRVKPAGLPYALAAAVVTVESRWRVNARGASGEYGLMQLMPATARHLGLRGNPYNPAANMRAGTKYLYRCYRRAGGSVPLTIGCYNRGPGNMRGWASNPITRRYVAKVRRLMRRG